MSEPSQSSKKSKMGLEGNRFVKPRPTPPALPKSSAAPYVNVESSSFSADLRKLLYSPSFSDVTFVFPDAQEISAHKIILSGACERLKMLLTDTVNSKKMEWIERTEPSAETTYIHVTASTSPHALKAVLEFLYCGTLTQPSPTAVAGETFLTNVEELATMIECKCLLDLCEHIRSPDVDQDLDTAIKNSIGTYMCELTCKALLPFLNDPLWTSTTLQVEYSLISVSKTLLCCRCEVLNSMLTGGFSEGRESNVEIQDCSKQSLNAILQYIYCDIAPIEQVDSFDLLRIADRFGLTRLVTLCELYITKHIERSIQDKIRDSNVNIYEVLQFASAFNATQLSAFCLHFIGSNYTVFRSSPWMSNLTTTESEIVAKSRWPPVWYEEKIEQYEKALAQWEKESNVPSDNKCLVM